MPTDEVMQDCTMDGVREYAEAYPVKLLFRDERWIVQARNEGGFNATEVDLVDLIAWLQRCRPEFLPIPSWTAPR